MIFSPHHHSTKKKLSLSFIVLSKIIFVTYIRVFKINVLLLYKLIIIVVYIVTKAPLASF